MSIPTEQQVAFIKQAHPSLGLFVEHLAKYTGESTEQKHTLAQEMSNATRKNIDLIFCIVWLMTRPSAPAPGEIFDENHIPQHLRGLYTEYAQKFDPEYAEYVRLRKKFQQ